MKRVFFVILTAFALLWAEAAEKLHPVHVPGSASTVGMALHKNALYTAGWDQLLVCYDVSVPGTPRKVWTFPGIYARQMSVSGNLLYITARHQGIWIFDVSAPLAPKLLNRFDTVELATGIAVADDLVITAERIYGSPVYSMKNPERPHLLSILRGGEIQSCAYRYPFFYGASWGAGKIYVWNLSDLRKPKKCSDVSLHGYGDGLALDGDYLYAATGMHERLCPKGAGKNNGWGLEIMDIKTNPAKPHPVGRIKFPPKPHGFFDSWTVRVANDVAYVGASANGVFIVDVKDKSKPQLLGHFELNPDEEIRDCVGSVAIGNGVVYIGTLKQGLFVLPFPRAVPENPNPPHVRTSRPAENIPLKLKNFTVYPVKTQARRLALDGDTLYAALGNGGIGVYDVASDGLKQRTCFSGKSVYDVAVRDGKLYAAEGDDGLAVYQLGDGKRREIGRLKKNCYTLHLTSDPRWILYTSRGIDFSAADIRDPKNIKEVFKHYNRGQFYLDSLGDSDFNGLYPVNGHDGGFYWLDLRGEKPKTVFHLKRKIAGQSSSVCKLGNKLFVPLGNSFSLLDPGAGPENAFTFKGDRRDRFGGMCAADGNIVAISGRNTGTLAVYDLGNPAKPLLLKERGFRRELCNPDRPVFWKGRILVPGGFAGIFFENERPADK